MIALICVIGAAVIPDLTTAENAYANPADDAIQQAGGIENGDTAFSVESSEDSATEIKAEEAKLPNKSIREIGLLSIGIMRYVGENWYVCGKKLDKAEATKHSTAIAYHVIKNMRDLGLNVSPWGIIGTMANESRFDHCALGLHPRKWGQRKGLLPKSKMTVSLRLADVRGFVSHPMATSRFSRSGFDLGLCQVLSKFYPGESDAMLTVDGGVRICVIEMQRRATVYGTDTPWLYWRGSKTDWYQRKIRRWARRMGATSKDMEEI